MGRPLTERRGGARALYTRTTPGDLPFRPLPAMSTLPGTVDPAQDAGPHSARAAQRSPPLRLPPRRFPRVGRWKQMVEALQWSSCCHHRMPVITPQLGWNRTASPVSVTIRNMVSLRSPQGARSRALGHLWPVHCLPPAWNLPGEGPPVRRAPCALPGGQPWVCWDASGQTLRPSAWEVPTGWNSSRRAQLWQGGLGTEAVAYVRAGVPHLPAAIQWGRLSDDQAKGEQAVGCSQGTGPGRGYG